MNRRDFLKATPAIGIIAIPAATVAEEDFGNVVRCGEYTATLNSYSRYWHVRGPNLRCEIAESWLVDADKRIHDVVRFLAK